MAAATFLIVVASSILRRRLSTTEDSSPCPMRHLLIRRSDNSSHAVDKAMGQRQVFAPLIDARLETSRHSAYVRVRLLAWCP